MSTWEREARAGLFDEGGRLLGAASRPIALFRSGEHVVEQSSGDIWSAV